MRATLSEAHGKTRGGLRVATDVAVRNLWLPIEPRLAVWEEGSRSSKRIAMAPESCCQSRVLSPASRPRMDFPRLFLRPRRLYTGLNSVQCL